MRADVAKDLSESAEAFVGIVWPAIEVFFGDGELKPVESVVSKGFQRDLDVLAGIDAWHVDYVNRGMRGIASRVQADGKAWNTFTIRYSRTTGAETEFSKRMKAINEEDRGWLYPHITVQAYRTPGGPESSQLISAGVVKTRELYCYARDHLNTKDAFLRPNRQDGNMFICVPWDSLERDGVRIRKWEGSQ